MLNRQERRNLKKNSHIKTTQLGLEQLESRMMNAIGGLEQNLQLMLSPPSLGSTQLVATNTTTANTTTVNSAPSIRTAPAIQSGTDVRTRSTVVSVLGSDDQAESQLTYTWQASTTPVGATVSFATNGTNQSKTNTVTFSKPGAYILRVTIRDQGGLTTSSTLQLNVVQALSSLRIENSNGTAFDLNQVQSVAGKTQTVQVKGLDQFGVVMTTVPTVAWSRVSGPTSGVVSTSTTNGVTTLTFDRIGAYQIRATSGAISADLKSTVVQTLTSIGIRDAQNQVVSTTTATSTVALNQRWSAIAFDQYGNTMTQQPTFTWTTPSSPIGSLPKIQTQSNSATVTFDRVGTYSLRAQSGTVGATFQVNVGAVLSRIALSTPSGTVVTSNTPIRNATTSQRLTVSGFDQFGIAMTTLPSLTWTSTTVPTQGIATASVASGIATISFNRVGTYALRVQGGTSSATLQVSVDPTLTQVTTVSATGAPLSTSSPIAVGGTNTSFRISGFDQFGQVLTQPPSSVWTAVTTPAGGTASFTSTTSGNSINFTKAGSYSIRLTAGGTTQTFTFNVTQTFTSIGFTASGTSLVLGATQQFSAQGRDQFGNPMTAQPTWTWSTTGGTISSSGLYTAGTQAGTYAVTVRSGTLTASVNVAVSAPTPVSSIADTALRDLVNRLYADNSITRAEMIQILRSVGTDGSVSQTELNDLRAIVGNGSQFNMPSYVRELAKDVVNDNPANLKFKGQAAGNLGAGSQASLLNNLVDKWFLGADAPVVSRTGLTYQISTGNLFNGAPSRADAKQGYLGDCYFIAAVTSIADASVDAIRNMFIDNGDGTYTVRFFSGTADYVTVDRRLPAYSNGTLAYSGVGQAIANTATTIWVALAEKAYAQWNETGKAGRNGTNTYSGIEGGWMGTVNSQVLGNNSSNYSFANTSKQTLINAFGSGRAVTLGTIANPTSGFVGSHAYLVTGYNASTDTFTVYNPWGNTHPGPVSWDQLRANCSTFVVTDSSGTSPISSLSVRSSTANMLIGNWTTAINGPSTFNPSSYANNRTRDYNDALATIDSVSKELENYVKEWESYDADQPLVADSTYGEIIDATLDELNAIHALAVDIAMGMEHLDSIFA